MDNNISNWREEYSNKTLSLDKPPADPIELFKQCFVHALDGHPFEPTAMVLSTVDAQGWPNSRVVLLKGLSADRFVFFSNYHSSKGVELAENPQAALNFYWPNQCLQIRIRGEVARLAEEESDDYFASRPRDSQISAIVSRQSSIIDNQQQLEDAVEAYKQDLGDAECERPDFWGGYALSAREYEFWLGRRHRLHDRLRYRQQQDDWIIERLSP